VGRSDILHNFKMRKKVHRKTRCYATGFPLYDAVFIMIETVTF
jgi:hypothetical protein